MGVATGSITGYGEDEVVASAAVVATGNSGELSGDYGTCNTLRAQLNVTAQSETSGAPTLDVTIEDSLDGSNWNAVMVFTQLGSETGREIKTLTTPFAKRLRVKWVIAGGAVDPSYTFDVQLVSQAPGA